MTPTIEEVAGWLREAGKKEEVQRLRSGASIHDARTEGERWYLRAAQVEAMGWPKTCDTCASYREYYEQVTNYNKPTNTCLDGYVHGKGPKFGCVHHKEKSQPPVKK